MSLQDKYNFEDLHNAAEEFVLDELEKQLSALSSAPEDGDAIIDMAAYALNLVQPMYRANLLGRLYEHALSEEHHREIEVAVKEAIKKILSNP